MPIHVAILRPPYPQLILDGRKTIESRLTKSPLEPFNQINTGERIFFKQTSGPFVATAIAGDVFFFDHLTPQKVAALKMKFNDAVCGDDAFWDWKRDANFATFIRLTQVQPLDHGPKMKKSSGLAWFVLDDALSPIVPVMFEIKLTAGAIKNHYVRIPRSLHEFPAKHYGGKTLAQRGDPITLIMPDGTPVETDIVSNQMIRWRGWLPWFKANHLTPGDVVRFTQLDAARYGVAFLHRR